MKQIARLRKQKGWSQEELAERLHVSRSAVAMWESGKNMPTAAMAYEMALLFGCGLNEVLGVYEPYRETEFPKKPVRIPVLGTIPAGIPIEAIEEVIDYEEAPAEWARGGKEYFALQIKGNSMAPRYESGDVVIFRRQETCENGQDCAVLVNGNDATFKRVRLLDDGMMLQALNPEYESYVYTAKQVHDLPVRIIGVVVELRRKF